MKLFLHIGTAKTGTTSVQQFLADNRLALRKTGLFLPESLGKSNHRKLQLVANDPDYVDDFTIRLGLTDKPAREAEKSRVLQAFTRELDQAETCDRAVITSEQLHTRLRRPREVARLADLLGQRFETVEIVLYIRRQIDYAVSSYSTLIKSGGTRDELADPGQLHIDYQQLIQRWQTGFPDARITVRLFEPSDLAGGDVITDFCRVIGLDPAGLKRPERQNASLDLMSLELLRRVNLLVPARTGNSHNPVRSNIVRFFERNATGPAKVATAAQIDAYEAFYAASNDWVCRAFFPDRQRLFAPASPRPSQPLAASDAELDHMAALLADVWTRKQKRLQQVQGKPA